MPIGQISVSKSDEICCRATMATNRRWLPDKATTQKKAHRASEAPALGLICACLSSILRHGGANRGAVMYIRQVRIGSIIPRAGPSSPPSMTTVNLHGAQQPLGAS